MKPFKVRKKPVVVEAMQYTGENDAEIIMWAHEGMAAIANAVITRDHAGLRIRTLESHEAPLFAKRGDWIIKGVKGEFYPCRWDIFNETYEMAE